MLPLNRVLSEIIIATLFVPNNNDIVNLLLSELDIIVRDRKCGRDENGDWLRYNQYR